MLESMDKCLVAIGHLDALYGERREVVAFENEIEHLRRMAAAAYAKSCGPPASSPGYALCHLT